MDFIASLVTPQVRDLAWACFSAPPVLARGLPDAHAELIDVTPALDTQRIHWLRTLDKNPRALLEYLEVRRGARLGIYFEQLWHFFLQQDSDMDMIAHNVPVRDSGQTRGEFDCLYHEQGNDRPVHLEMAVKFYLAVTRTSGETIWLGPNRRDQLDTKLSHLLSHQTRLSDHPVAAAVLSDHQVVRPRRALALRGYLFQPWQSTTPSPPGFNVQTSLYHWLPHDQLETYLLTRDAQAYRTLPKARWLAPANLTDPGDSPLSREALPAMLATRLDALGGPVMVSELSARGTEASRFFVTPDGWPEDTIAA
ncbi:MAG: DUF1853 family protein [Pseudomonadota bacterium]